MGMINTVAVIGGGVSGLAAGGLLSRHGLEVKLFEANAKLGGCCANTEIDGYTFHDGALYLAFAGVLEHVFAKLGLNRAALLPLRKITANQTTTLPDGTVVTFGAGLEVRVSERDQAKQDQLHKELDHLLKKWEPVRHLFAEDILLHPLSLSRLMIKGWRHLPKLRGSVASEITRFFSDEAVRAAMSGVTLYAGKPPQHMPVQSILGLVAMLIEGFYLPEGGMGRIPEALSQSLKQNGGQIHLNSRVNKIILRNGRVHGLEVEGQGFVHVDAVVATTSGMLTFGALLSDESMPAQLTRKVQNAPLSHKAFVVQLGLSNQIEVDSHSNSFLPLIGEQFQVFTPVEDEVRWPVYSVPTVTAPELASRGGTIVEAFPPVSQTQCADEWDAQQVERVTAATLKTLARLHKMDITVTRVRSPQDFQNQLHLYQGAVYGLSPAADLRAYFQHTTPIGGLFQAGQTTYPGYGVSSAAMSGLLAAEALLRMAKR